MHEQENFARIRRRGNRREDDTRYDLDAAFAEYAARFGQDTASEAVPHAASGAAPDDPPHGDRWSTWDHSTAGERGPLPRPEWVVTELAAVDTELGVLKTGKEADVFLVERGVPDTGPAVLMAAKRYRDPQHRMFHRDSGYLEGRQDKESRVNRAMAKRTAFGKEVIAGQWANAEFAALSRMWSGGVAVPYPVQIVGTELLMEFVGGDDGAAAPRLAQLRPSPPELTELWDQLRGNLSLMAREGLAHGDLSAYNILVHDGRLVIIDVPQIVDVIVNPNGPAYLERDVRNVGNWFVARGLDSGRVDELAADLLRDTRPR
ncbi:RIO kinase 1 [Haloactinopolyspora alba]|uniref:non-specific serine/threonine protein kinase n=1 Tax=Haloactinopolyspora alba TaxID=648780 RepID=A0A2P8DXC0_9ACTN|nr:RIO1 family regulatory kinase/ATPase [Haloactinopolyspora alba]PSL01864.1 RIO kinase 1 [Haloactinopolyspora alba]